MRETRVHVLICVALIIAISASGQQAPSVLDSQLVAVNATPNLLLPGILAVNTAVGEKYDSCSVADLQSTPTLTLAQRACLYRSRLLSKSFPIRAAAFSAVSEWRNKDIKNPGFEDFTHRFATYYARRTAQNTGEFLAGYLNHEDPRYRPSLENGIWKRSKSALLSVLVSKDADGNGRMALAPIAGALGSGMVGIACYGPNNSVGDGFRRSATAYGFYFGTAIFREFRPELMGLKTRFTHRP